MSFSNFCNSKYTIIGNAYLYLNLSLLCESRNQQSPDNLLFSYPVDISGMVTIKEIEIWLFSIIVQCYVLLTVYRGKISILLTSAAFTKVNSSTSPSLFSGLKSIGSSKSNTNSVCGNIPLSDSKKNLIEIKRDINVR